jgi:hypothetical protein
MALNSSGQISLGGATTGESVNLELQQSATATITLNDANVRTLFGVSSGQISLNTGWGKSAGNTWLLHGYPAYPQINRVIKTNNKSLLVSGYNSASYFYQNITSAGNITWSKVTTPSAYTSNDINYSSTTNTWATLAFNAASAFSRTVGVWDISANKLQEFTFGGTGNNFGGYNNGNKWDGTNWYDSAYYDPTDDATFIKVNNSGIVFARYYGNNVTTGIDNFGTTSAFDGSGNLYSFVQTGLSSASGSTDNVHIIKYSSSGVLQWHRRVNYSTLYTYGGVLKVTSDGTVYAGGYTYGAIPGTFIYWFMKIDTNGNLVWQRNFPQTVSEPVYPQGLPDISVSSAGNVYIAFQGKFAKYSSSGVLQWIKALVGSTITQPYKWAQWSISCEDDGDVITSGIAGMNETYSGGATLYGGGGYVYTRVHYMASFKPADIIANKSFAGAGDPNIGNDLYLVTPTYTEDTSSMGFAATSFGAESAFACSFSNTSAFNITGDSAQTWYKRT